MSGDDVAFYLPALGSFALAGIPVVLGYALVRLVRSRKAKGAVEKSRKS